jgi:hypothetical protein
MQRAGQCHLQLGQLEDACQGITIIAVILSFNPIGLILTDFFRLFFVTLKKHNIMDIFLKTV